MKEQKRSFNIIAAVAGSLILIGAVIFVVLLFGATKQETEAVIDDQTLQITGQYGTSYLLSEIDDIHLSDTIPEIGRKVNGAGLGDTKKGDFEVDGLGTCRLFIHSANGPYLLFNTNSGYVIMNFEDTQKTEALFAELYDNTH